MNLVNKIQTLAEDVHLSLTVVQEHPGCFYWVDELHVEVLGAEVVSWNTVRSKGADQYKLYLYLLLLVIFLIGNVDS